MGKYKICVYGVCKNEEKFAKRCMDSLKDADLVVFDENIDIKITIIGGKVVYSN